MTNEAGKLGHASTAVTVSNVPPQFTAADLSLSEPAATEGDTVTLTGQFTDPDPLNTYDGDHRLGRRLDAIGTELRCWPGRRRRPRPGCTRYSAAHQYLTNPPGIPTGGTYPIHVSVSDGTSTTSAGTSIVVNDAPPTVQLGSTGSQRPGDDHPDAPPRAIRECPETVTFNWTLTDDGTVIQTGTGDSFTFTPPPPPAILIATATATNTDGRTGNADDQFTIV